MQVWIRRCALLLLPLGFLAVMVAAPLLSLAFYDGEGAWAEVVADDYMRLRLGWTVAQAVLTCLRAISKGLRVSFAADWDISLPSYVWLKFKGFTVVTITNFQMKCNSM